MTRKNKIRLGELFPDLGLVGDFSSLESLEIGGIADAGRAGSGDLVFLAQDRLLSAMSPSGPAAAVVSEALWKQATSRGFQFPLLRSRDAMLAFAKASRHFLTEQKPGPGVHPTAAVHPGARVAAGAAIGPHCTVEQDAEIGQGVVLHSGVSVGARSRVGKDSVLFSGVKIYQDVVLGERVRIHSNSVIGADGFGYVQEKHAGGVRHVKIHHIGGVKIGNDVEIGASTTIDRGTLGDTVVGDGCIIDNQVQIGHNCHLEEGVIICGCSGLSGSVHVERFALIAGFSAVNNKVRIGAGAQVAGFTPVTGHVPPGAKWGGMPAMPRNEFARLQVLFKRLPELFEKRKKEGKI